MMKYMLKARVGATLMFICLAGIAPPDYATAAATTLRVQVASKAQPVPESTARSCAPRQNEDGSYTMTSRSLGVNTTNFDHRFTDTAVAKLLDEAGIGVVRYPGGSNADHADWAHINGVSFTQFMRVLDQFQAAPLLTINYGQTSLGPSVAAAWVHKAQSFSNYTDKTALWVLGNEGYGPWEFDEHPNPHTPRSFAKHALTYFKAVHGVDAHAHVGFPVSISRDIAGGTGTWVPDPALWNKTILQQDGPQIDFIDFHWYPIFGRPVLSNKQIFATVKRIPKALHYLHSLLDKYDPKACIIQGEGNISQSEIVYNVQPVAALYAAASALEFLSHGAISSLWWQVHNKDNMNGDFGLLSDGTGHPGPIQDALTQPAKSDTRNIATKHPRSFYYGHQFYIGRGQKRESRKVTAVAGHSRLAAKAEAGRRNIKVSSVTPFAAGAPITIGTGANVESRTVVSAGTGASTATLAAPAVAGNTNVKIVGVAMGGRSIPVFMPSGFAPGAKIKLGSGRDAETATVTKVGSSSSRGTDLVASAAPGDTTVYVAAVTNTHTGVANYVGDPITIGSAGKSEVRIITKVGTGAAKPTRLAAPAAAGDKIVTIAGSGQRMTVGHPVQLGGGARAIITHIGKASMSRTSLTLSEPLKKAYHPGTSIRDLGTGIRLSAALKHAHKAGAMTRDTGTGLSLRQPLRNSHAMGQPATTPGTGLVLSSALNHDYGIGAPISSSGITFTPALNHRHAKGAKVSGRGLKEPPVNTPLPAYWGYVLASKLVMPGAHLATLASPKSSIIAYRSLLPDGSTAVMLINTSDTAAATLSVHGMAGGERTKLQTSTYSLEHPSIVRGTMTAQSARNGLVLPPESIVVLTAAKSGTAMAISLEQH